jgi:type 1 fimbria pilin
MKKYLAALSATALIGIAPYALAAPSTDLTVIGTITPNACTPTVSNGGVVDHKTISSEDLNQDKSTNLPDKTLQLSVSCGSAIAFRLKPIDNRIGSDIGTYYFGLGYINGNQKLGSVEVQIRSPLADGVPVQPLQSNDDGNTWYQTSFLAPNTLAAFRSTGGPYTPIAIKELITDLRIYTQIARADSLDLTNDVALDGSITLEVEYP